MIWLHGFSRAPGSTTGNREWTCIWEKTCTRASCVIRNGSLRSLTKWLKFTGLMWLTLPVLSRKCSKIYAIESCAWLSETERRQDLDQPDICLENSYLTRIQ